LRASGSRQVGAAARGLSASPPPRLSASPPPRLSLSPPLPLPASPAPRPSPLHTPVSGYDDRWARVRARRRRSVWRRLEPVQAGSELGQRVAA
jgi:hypothetical protein